jgi:hypothetical protein
LESLSLPSLVRSEFGSGIDVLPSVVKAVLLDSAVLGDTVCDMAIVAMGATDTEEVSWCLQYLEEGAATTPRPASGTVYGILPVRPGSCDVEGR